MPDFLTVAKGFGCNAKCASNLGEFTRLLQNGLKADRPTLLEIQPEKFAWQD